jgi:hypothetical protein
MLKSKTTGEVKNAVAWTLKFKFKLILDLNLSLF